MSSSAELNFDLSTRIMVLDAGMYIVRLLATNPAPETCVTVQQSPLGRGTVDFFPAEGVTRNTLSSPGDCIVIRVKGSQAGLLVTEIHTKGTERVSLMVDRIVTGAELVANGVKTTRVGEAAGTPELATTSLNAGAIDDSATGSTAGSAASASARSNVSYAAATSAAATAASALRTEPATTATPANAAPRQQANPVQSAAAVEPTLNAFAPVGAVQAAATAAANEQAAPAVAPGTISITHVGHVEYKGDVSVTNAWLGNPTSTHRLEGFALTWNDMPAGVNLAYSCRTGAGAEPQIGLAGQFVGTRRQAKPITAVAFVLSGPRAHEFELSGHVAFAGLPPFAIVPGQELSGPSGAEHLVALQLVVTPKASQPVPSASPWNNTATARTFRAS